MAVKFGVALGLDVTVISSSEKKRAESISTLKATSFLLSTDKSIMASSAGSLDAIISTISAPYDMNLYSALLKTDGKMILVGIPPASISVPRDLISRRITIAGSCIGSIQETQEMLDFCGTHGIVSDVEVIDAGYVNTAFVSGGPDWEELWRRPRPWAKVGSSDWTPRLHLIIRACTPFSPPLLPSFCRSGVSTNISSFPAAFVYLTRVDGLMRARVYSD